MSKKIINPILSGFYPDPSVCVANGKFYLVNSSFSYFPGLPIFESSDCCEWTQIGNVIDRDSQLNFSGQGVSRGLFAPTIRYNNGKFYCICTQVDRIGNFFVTADKPEGPWSDPIVIEGAEGIDPSLFFDDDGTVWYIGTRPAPEGCKYNGNWEIWIQQIDINTGKLLGDSKGIWRGALKDCVWPEGPHIYKIDGMYYLLHAEGGTGPDHAVCVARCATIDGEWEGKKSNPILTHRHLGKTAGVVYVGHADLFCDNNNRWWMVCLASRPYGEGENRCCNMGRETFLVPVKWEDGWPVASWQTGLVENAYTIEGNVSKREIGDKNAVNFPKEDDFNSENLDMYWLGLRRIDKNYINCTENLGNLRLYGGSDFDGDNVSFIARRQTSFSFKAYAKLCASFNNDNDSAGLICFQNEKFYYKVQFKLTGKIVRIQLIKCAGENEELLAEDVYTGGTKEVCGILKVVAEKQSIRFEYGNDDKNLTTLAENIDASILSVEKAGGFVGTVIGMFAVSGGDFTKKDFYADFDWFKYEDFSKDWTL